ncbi:hypothetical protein [Burkholderia sp. Ac-20379]|uniref:hypothetical protein n=1 Tax=Burkholderia sp. Ac-20379 TaxID=2703900 RepID=UPI00197D3ABE|nr:hypothetical protein [Burkholderia sp. Ac-20379]MBN3723456.1 hypothetical protein [Burkholderia sp. Ac-20379]
MTEIIEISPGCRPGKEIGRRDSPLRPMVAEARAASICIDVAPFYMPARRNRSNRRRSSNEEIDFYLIWLSKTLFVLA